MSEPAPPAVPGRPAERAAPALTPEGIDALLADFRAWLTDAASSNAAPPSAEKEPPDLHTLLGQFLAVRQEVNLLTRATRAQQEQQAETLRQLSAALEALQRSQTTAGQVRQPDGDEALRPLLKTLVDVHDALSLAEREARRVQEIVLPALAGVTAPPPDDPLDLTRVEVPPLPEPARPLLARLLGARAASKSDLTAWQEQACRTYEKAMTARQDEARATREERQRQAAQGVERVRQLLDSLLTGYRMGLQRIERALVQHGLEAIPASGHGFDPERMEVLEAVGDSGRAPGEVLEEVRRGYLWRGRVFRFAQVRVARS